MRSSKIKEMVMNAMFISILAIMTFIPNLGYIPINPALNVTIIHVVVIVAAIVGGFRSGLVAGSAWGILCFLKAIILPTAPLDPVFVNPLISVLPRVLMGGITGVIGDIIKNKLFDKKVAYPLYAVLGALGAFLNTLFVLGALFFLSRETVLSFGYENNFFLFIGAMLVSNGFLEMLVAAIAAPFVAIPVLKSRKYKGV